MTQIIIANVLAVAAAFVGLWKRESGDETRDSHC